MSIKHTKSRMLTHTGLSLVIVPVIALIVAAIAGAVLHVMNDEGSASGLSFFAAAAGGVVGIFAAHAACEKWIPAYRSRILFIWLAVLVIITICAELATLPVDHGLVVNFVQLAALVGAAFAYFWKAESAT